MKIYDFKSSNETGKIGEAIIKQYIQNKQNVKKVSDISKNKFYQDKDIDFVVDLQGEFLRTRPDLTPQQTIEVKTDTYDSPNIFYETISNLECNVPGCMVKSEADYLYYFFINTGELYIIKLPLLKTWFEENKNGFQKRRLQNYRRKRELGLSTSEGYLIPKVILETECPGVHKISMPQKYIKPYIGSVPKRHTT